MNRKKTGATNIDRVYRHMKESTKPQCVHRISKKLSLQESTVSSVMWRLEFEKHLVVKTAETGTCRWSNHSHAFFNYSGMPEIQENRSAKVGEQLRNEFKGKLAKQHDEVLRLRDGLSREKFKVDVLKEMLREALVSV